MQATTTNIETQLLRLLDQVLEMLSLVCRREEAVNSILQDYHNASHLTSMIEDLVRVATDQFKLMREENDRLNTKLQESLKTFKLERLEHIKLEKELKNYIETLQAEQPQPSVTLGLTKPRSRLKPPLVSTAETMQSTSLDKRLDYM